MNRGALLARGVRTAGYRRAIEDKAGDRGGVAGDFADEYTSRAPSSLLPSPSRSLGLEVRETPDVPRSPIASWASPLRFADGPKALEEDATAAIQAAIDSGAETVYLPAGKYRLAGTVLVRGKVRRILGCRANLDVPERKAPAFKVVDSPGGAPRRGHRADRRRLHADPDLRQRLGPDPGAQELHQHPLHFTGTGDVFIEDLCSNPQAGLLMGKQRVWARQLNVENEGTHALNDGGTLWVLGLKTERGGTLIETRGGGKTEVLGGFSYTTSAGKLADVRGQRLIRVLRLRRNLLQRRPLPHPRARTRGGRTEAWGRDRGGLDPLFVAAPR